jgi:hypothetical protein
MKKLNSFLLKNMLSEAIFMLFDCQEIILASFYYYPENNTSNQRLEKNLKDYISKYLSYFLIIDQYKTAFHSVIYFILLLTFYASYKLMIIL